MWGGGSTISGLSVEDTSATFGSGSFRFKPRNSESSNGNAAHSYNNIVPKSSFRAQSDARANELDLGKLRFDHLTLYGRDEQTRKLEQAFQNVLSSSSAAAAVPTTTAAPPPAVSCNRGLVLIQGESGTGKTSFVQQSSFQRLIRAKQGIYTFGKCELQQVDEPYASIQDALGLLCYRILQLPRRQKEQHQQQQEERKPASASRGEGSSKADASLSSTTESTGSSSTGERHKITVEDIQDNIASELDEREWKFLVQAVPGVEKIMMGSYYSLVAEGEGGNPNSPEDGASGIPEAPDANATNKKDAQNDGSAFKESSDRLKYVYRHFLRAIASVCPLVLVLDDCQWMDKASLEWIKSIVKDTSTSFSKLAMADLVDKNDNNNNNTTITGSNGPLLVVASYRTNEVGEDHELSKMVRELRRSLPQQEGEEDVNCKPDKGGVPDSLAASSPASFLLEEIQIGNLSTEDINAMLVELQNSHCDKTLELAQLLYQKTSGNAFFVIQFLLRLKDDNELSYNLGAMKWMWDVGIIRDKYSSTDNVADLMKEKMQNNTMALHILPFAACLGTTFSHVLLQDVIIVKDTTKSTNVTVTESLEHCVSEGFLEYTQDGMYRFVHDKIQEAALEFLEKETKLDVGGLFLERFIQQQEHFGDTIYSAVQLANLQIDRLPKNDEKLLRLAEMNALAGKKALECTAFDSATRYLSIAISLLPDDHWTNHQDISLGIYNLAAAAAYCSGNPRQVKACAEILREQSHIPLLEKIDLFHTMMDVHEASIESAANVELGLQLLKGFKCVFPKSGLGITVNTVASLLKAKLQLKKKLSSGALTSRPIVMDKRTMSLMKTLDKFSSATFHAKPELLPLVILRMAKYTDQFGLNPYATVTYPVLGLLFAGVLEDFETAKICGEAGIAIMKRCNFPIINSRCIMLAYFYALHWSTPIKNCLRPLLEGYEIGMKMGTLDGAFWCICFFLEFSFWSGGKLALLQADYTTYIHQMEDYNVLKAHAVMKFTRHMVARLRGVADDSDEFEFDAFCKEKGDEGVECTLRRTQMYVACILGDHEKTAQMSLIWQEKVMKLLPAQANTLEVTFVSALSCMAVSRQNPKSTKYMKQGRRCWMKIKSWVNKTCPNCVAHEALLEAEWLALKGNKGMALQRFEAAVLLAGRRGLTHVQALANERFAMYLREVGEEQDATYRLDQAIKLYAEWGAAAKVEKLESMLNVGAIAMNDPHFK